eukprot:TRINITY_DN9487_c0_g1_i1.p1 TRINITY_DN9487_c0_g1~~TRINITY_DN9487_c0_g1_i1.p1  ORF type:complete len:503 (+),score=125.27 TRINITY_DN9487_c0_g1_i1:53-1561(+)
MPGKAVSREARDALLAALSEAEDGHGDALTQWCVRHDGGAEVVVAEEASKPLSIMGSALYIAVVGDMPAAVGHLLARRLGGGCNDRHAVHSDTALLHACEQGYKECVEALLRAGTGMDVRQHLTVDRRLFLGQGVPQWEEGGRSALVLAAEKAQEAVVRILLDGGLLPADSLNWLLTHPDTFGRTPLRVVLDALPLAAHLPSKQASLRRIAAAIIDAGGGLADAPEGGDVAAFIERHTPDAAAARETERARVRAVRERVLTAQKAAKEAERVRGLRAVEEHYRPLHGGVYTTELLRDVVWDPRAVEEPFPGVFAFPFLPPAASAMLWQELHHYEAAARDRPEHALPHPIRHDGNFGDLQDCGFRPALDRIMDALAPLLRQHLPDSLGPYGVEATHAFLTRNYVGRDQNATFKMHCDKSELTVNVCLHAADGFAGSTVGFYQPKEPELTPEDEDRRYTHVHSVGRAVVHTGATWHRTDPITSGTRGSLIVWARRREAAEPKGL